MKNTIITIPEPTLKRLPVYYQIINNSFSNDEMYISCNIIGEALESSPIQVRKDLGYLNITGTPKKGYLKKDLLYGIEELLNWKNTKRTILVGAGNLGKALLSYYGSTNKNGFQIFKAFDVDECIIGSEIFNIKIEHTKNISKYIKDKKIETAFLTTPSNIAQKVTDVMVKSGIRGILNFAPLKLNTPPTVMVQNINLASYLAVISKFLNKYSGGQK